MAGPTVHKLKILAATALCCLPLIGAAQGATQKDALVISSFAQPGDPIARDVRSDALSVSEALLGLGYNVQRLENPASDVVSGAIADGPTVIYYAGTEADLVPEISAELSDLTAEQTLVFLDMCRASLVLDDSSVSAWTLPENLPENVFMAASVSPDEPCGIETQPVTEQLLEGLQVPGISLTLAFAQQDDAVLPPVWTLSTLAEPFVFRQPSSDTRLTAEDYALLETLSPDARAQMIALWTQAGIAVDLDGAVETASLSPQVVVQDTIVISAPVQPISGISQVIAPRSAAPVQDGISVIAPSATTSSENRAVPGVGGLPAPSVIVGIIATEASFGTVTEDGGALSGSEFDYTNIAARRAMREEDPDLFASLIDSGAFDPPETELVVALQTELTRMACYDRGIDGSWGGGSEAGLRRYYEAISQSPDNLDPSFASFRQIIARDDVVCPPIVVAQPRSAAPQAAAPRRAATTSTPAPRRQAAPAPAAPAPAPSRTINRSVGTGVFR